jgi:hypothetical protein
MVKGGSLNVLSPDTGLRYVVYKSRRADACISEGNESMASLSNLTII